MSAVFADGVSDDTFTVTVFSSAFNVYLLALVKSMTTLLSLTVDVAPPSIVMAFGSKMPLLFF